MDTEPGEWCWTADIRTAFATCPEVTDGVTAAYQLALGHGPNAVEVAAAQSELLSGITMSVLQVELGKLSGRPIPRYAAFLDVTPRTVAG